MPFYRVQVAHERGNDLSVDDCVNTFYLSDIGPTSSAADLCQDAADLFATYRNHVLGFTRITAKIYDMAAPVPRPPLATKTAIPQVGGAEGGPSEVALCLSFYATSNQKRRRGRLYIGPFAAGQMERRPAANVTSQLADLAAGLANLGGVDVDWMQYSPTNNAANKVTNWWVDNEWDTVRSRGLKGTSRITGVTGE